LGIGPPREVCLRRRTRFEPAIETVKDLAATAMSKSTYSFDVSVCQIITTQQLEVFYFSALLLCLSMHLVKTVQNVPRSMRIK
jgi:hypothetical protein